MDIPYSSTPPSSASTSICRYYAEHNDLTEDLDLELDTQEEGGDFDLFDPPFDFDYWGVIGALDDISSVPTIKTTTSAKATVMPTPTQHQPCTVSNFSTISTSTATSCTSNKSSSSSEKRSSTNLDEIFDGGAPLSAFVSPLDFLKHTVQMKSMASVLNDSLLSQQQRQQESQMERREKWG